MDDDIIKGYSEEMCIRCGWVMGHPPLNCQNDNTPHVFPSQQAEIERLRAQFDAISALPSNMDRPDGAVDDEEPTKPYAVVVRMNYLTDPELTEEVGVIRHAVYEWSDYEEEYTFLCWTLNIWHAKQIASALISQEDDHG